MHAYISSSTKLPTNGIYVHVITFVQCSVHTGINVDDHVIQLNLRSASNKSSIHLN